MEQGVKRLKYMFYNTCSKLSVCNSSRSSRPIVLVVVAEVVLEVGLVVVSNVNVTYFARVSFKQKPN